LIAIVLGANWLASLPAPYGVPQPADINEPIKEILNHKDTPCKIAAAIIPITKAIAATCHLIFTDRPP
jgi:hypothetical protein